MIRTAFVGSVTVELMFDRTTVLASCLDWKGLMSYEDMRVKLANLFVGQQMEDFHVWEVSALPHRYSTETSHSIVSVVLGEILELNFAQVER